jgi:N-ethylmaleimide reductase
MGPGPGRIDTGVDLFSPVALGDLQLANRVVMAPLTRMRSGASGVPGDLVVEHYRQRAGVGLIITEGTYPNHESQAFVGQPGIVTDEQVEGWRRVASAVHERGGTIVMQVMHGGRVTHPDVNGGRRVVGPSAITINGEGHTEKGKQPYPVPHALSTEEAHATLQDFVAASRRAIEAGLDGVEIHGANGYLLHEFLSPASNRRDDVYGGSPEIRARFVVEVVTAVAEVIGAGRVGLRISPEHTSRTRSRPTATTCSPPTARSSTSCGRSGSPTCRCCTRSLPVTWCRNCAGASAATSSPTAASAP